MRTGKRDNEVCVPLNFALICTQPLQTCPYSYLVLFVTAKISYSHSMYSSNIWPNFHIGLIARTVQVFANITIDHNFETQHLRWSYMLRAKSAFSVNLNSFQQNIWSSQHWIHSFLRTQYIYIVWFALAYYSDTPIIRTLPVSKGVCIIGLPMYTLFS